MPSPRCTTSTIPLDDAHRIDGLRMIAGKQTRELLWPATGRFPAEGAVWPRRRLDKALIDAAAEAGAEIRWETPGEPLLDDTGRVFGILAGDTKVEAGLVVAATGPPGKVARMLGAERVADEPFGLAIRTYVESPRHGDRHLEACLTLRDEHGVAVPGYGWMFPAGDGTVNIGVGALSTMKGFKRLNLSKLLDNYRSQIDDSWEVGEYLERPRSWRLPMSSRRRHGPGWVAVGDAAGLINPMNGEGIDYGLESGHARRRPVSRRPRLGTREVRHRGRRPLRRVLADRPPVRVPDRSSRAVACRVADGGRHADDRHDHAAGDGQPPRLRRRRAPPAG